MENKTTVQKMKDTLRKYLTQYNNLENQNTLLTKEADAQTWEFVSERQAGMKGKLPSSLFPTLQDLTIYMFYGSIITLFAIMGSTSSILSVTTDNGPSNLSQYIFIAGVIITFLTSFYSTVIAFILLVLVLIYFITVGYKPFLFFVSFILTMALTIITVNSTL